MLEKIVETSTHSSVVKLSKASVTYNRLLDALLMAFVIAKAALYCEYSILDVKLLLFGLKKIMII